MIKKYVGDIKTHEDGDIKEKYLYRKALLIFLDDPHQTGRCLSVIEENEKDFNGEIRVKKTEYLLRSKNIDKLNRVSSDGSGKVNEKFIGNTNENRKKVKINKGFKKGFEGFLHIKVIEQYKTEWDIELM